MKKQVKKKIRKAIIPVAGRATRMYPATRSIPKSFLPLPGADGCLRPVVHHAVNAVLDAGIEEVALVVDTRFRGLFERYFSDGHDEDIEAVFPGGHDICAAAIDELKRMHGRVELVEQSEPLGFGAAVGLCRDFAAGEPVLVMLGDYFFAAGPDGVNPIAVILECWSALDCRSLVGVRRIGPAQLATCGIVHGEKAAGRDALWRVESIAEKPDADFARKRMQCNDLPDDTYLGHFGLYAFNAAIFDILDALSEAGKVGVAGVAGGEVQLSDAQQAFLAGGGSHLGLELSACALDLGNHAGFCAAWRQLQSL